MSSKHVSFRCISDGRCDSPGFSAARSTYTVIDHDSHRILSLQLLDKRQVQLKSPNMEKLGCQQALREIKAKGVKVTEFVTDAHKQVAKMISKLSSFEATVKKGPKNMVYKFNSNIDNNQEYVV